MHLIPQFLGKPMTSGQFLPPAHLLSMAHHSGILLGGGTFQALHSSSDRPALDPSVLHAQQGQKRDKNQYARETPATIIDTLITESGKQAKIPTVFHAHGHNANEGKWVLPPEFELYRTVLENGIHSPEDLKLIEDFLGLIDPTYSARIITLIQNEGIPITLNADGSSAYIKKETVFDRENSEAFASKITLKKGATVFDVIHEYTHAVPRRYFPAPLKEVSYATIDKDAKVKTLIEALMTNTNVEEGNAFGSEAYWIKKAAAKGVIPPLTKTEEKFANTYFEGGVAALAQIISATIPSYRTRFRMQAHHQHDRYQTRSRR